MFIYIGNLSVDTSQQDLLDLFEQYGSVASVNVLTDEISGNPLGFAFVEMPEDSEALGAINALDRTRIGGRIVMVCETPARLERRQPTAKRHTHDQHTATILHRS